MNPVRRRLTLAALLVAGVLAGGAFVPAAFGQVFPAKPVTLICPWPPGGSTDIHLRKMAELASKHLGQQVVVENRPGGSGMNSPATMAKTAAGDGYTISQLPITAYRVPYMQKVDWDPSTTSATSTGPPATPSAS